MSNWWLVNKNTKEMIGHYSNERKEIHMADASQTWLEIPEGIHPGNCKVIGDGGELSLVADSAHKEGSLWVALRAERKARLTECDWVLLPDVTMTKKLKDKWLKYRKALKDLPENTEDPEQVIWPESPEE